MEEELITEPPPARAAGAVASSHYLATEAGADAIRAGGNAIDAAIAAAAVLCVVYPNNVALGGDLVALVRDPAGRIRFVNATGRSSRNGTLDDLTRRYGRSLPDQGIDTVTVPGGVAGWAALADSGSRLTWTELLGSARRLAEEAPVARSLAHAISAERDVLARDPGCAAVFLPGGRALGEADLLHQPALADTLDALITEGPETFYRGTLARRWVRGLQRLGSLIDEADAASFRATVEEPISASARGIEVVTSPPNTQGFSLLRTVRNVRTATVEEALGSDAMYLAEIFAANNRVRSSLLSDPDVATGHDLITCDAPQALPHSPAARGDTVGLVAMSADGWSVSLVQSVYWAFGAAILDPQTGILFQNRGTSFSLDPRHPAVFAPGRRPPHTLMPVMVLRNGELAWTQATMGGQAQPQIHAHLLLRLLAGVSAIEATSAPRWVVGAQESGDTAATLTVEADVPSSTRHALTGAAFDLKIVPPRDERLGHSNVIRALPSGYDAASDPRSDGSAVIVS